MRAKAHLFLSFILVLTLTASGLQAAELAQRATGDRDARLQAWSDAMARTDSLGDPR